MNNQNQMERISEFLASFHQRPIICRSSVGCREMQPCAQGKAEGRFTASSWQHWMNTCRFTCGFWKVTGNYKEHQNKIWTLSNISDGYLFQKIIVKNSTLHVSLGSKHASKKYFS